MCAAAGGMPRAAAPELGAAAEGAVRRVVVVGRHAPVGGATVTKRVLAT